MRREDRLAALEDFYLDESRWPTIDREHPRALQRVRQGIATRDDWERVSPGMYALVCRTLQESAVNLRLDRLLIPLVPVDPDDRQALTRLPEVAAAATICSYFPDETPPPHYRELLERALDAPLGTRARTEARLAVMAMGGLDHQPSRAILEEHFAWDYLSRLGETDTGAVVGRLADREKSGCRRSNFELKYGLLPDPCYDPAQARDCTCQHEPDPPNTLAPSCNSPEHQLHAHCYIITAEILKQRANLIHHHQPDEVILIESAEELRDRIWRALMPIINNWTPPPNPNN